MPVELLVIAVAWVGFTFGPALAHLHVAIADLFRRKA